MAENRPAFTARIAFYRDLTSDYLYKELGHATEKLAAVPQGRARFHQMSKIAAMLSELAWRDQEENTGTKRDY